MKFSQPRDYRFVVGIPPVTVQLDKIGEQETDKVQGIRTLLMTGDLRTLPWAQVVVEFAAEFSNLLADALHLADRLEYAELLCVGSRLWQT